MARSAPRASASLITLFTRCGPIEQTTTSPPSFSRTRKASSSAYPSDSLTSKERSPSSIHVASLLIRRIASLFATCFIITMIFISSLCVLQRSMMFIAYLNQPYGAPSERNQLREHEAINIVCSYGAEKHCAPEEHDVYSLPKPTRWRSFGAQSFERTRSYK